MTGIDWEALRGKARQAMANAYAPYSRYPVGVAGLVDDGRIVSGCNVENASFGLTLCAECGMVSELAATGGGRLVAIACVDGAGEPRFTSPVRRWCTCDRLRIEHAVSNHSQAAGSFGHEHRAIGKKCQAPWEFECTRHGGHANALPFPGVELHRLLRQLATGQPARRDGDSSLERHRLLTRAHVSPECDDPNSSQSQEQAVLGARTWPSHSEICFLQRHSSIGEAE